MQNKKYLKLYKILTILKVAQGTGVAVLEGYLIN